MLVIFCLFASLLIFLSYRSYRGGVDFLDFVKREIESPAGSFTPFATIAAPCRGLDVDLEANLSSLLDQDYPEYEVIFVADDERDDCFPVLERLSERAGERARIVLAPKATDSSQKVENLREAVLHADIRSHVFVFVDSDARPDRKWLRHLVAPLEDETVGATTGYRWFISQRASFASALRSVWNASIASALGPKATSNFCWGGSMAIRRETFEKIEMRERWRGTLSDDLTATRALKEAGLTIRFVPQALAASVADCGIGELLEFTTRQLKITRVYAPRLWKLSFFGSGLFCLVMLGAILLIIFSDRNSFAFGAAVAALVPVAVFSVGKSWLRLKAVRLAMPQFEREIKRQILPQCTMWPLSQFLFLYNCFAAGLSRRVRWRGTEYEMVSPKETRVISSPQPGKLW